MTNNFYATFFLFFFFLTGCAATNPPPSDTKKPTSDNSSSSNQIPTVDSKSSNQIATADSKGTNTDNKKLSKQEIIQVQQQLSELGYKPGTADGQMGKGTTKAIKKFQQDNILAETGKANLQTTSMLEQKIKERSAPPSIKSQAAPASLTTSQDNTQVQQTTSQDNTQVKPKTAQAKVDDNQADQNNDPSNQRTIVSGGLDNNMLNKLWKAAKTKCYELRYTVANDDKETGNLVCVFATDAGQNMMLVNFDTEGFLVTVKGSVDNIPILGGIFKGRLNEHKVQMDNALKAAAGISK